MRMYHIAFFIFASLFLALLQNGEAQILPTISLEKKKMPDSQLKQVRNGFDKRIAQAFAAERGKPLVRAKKNPPLKPGRGNYVRAYSWSIMDFATRCFVLNEQVEEANAALIENAQHYIDNPKDVNDRDSFHWHADMVCRLIEMYGSKGSTKPGLLKAETQDIIMQPLWMYSNTCVSLADADVEKARNWHVHESDNHNTMHFTTDWHTAKLAKDHPAYRDRKFDDGSTPAQRYAAWNEYIKVYCQERAKKGLFIEIACDGYNVVGMKGFHNIYDFADDPVLKKRAGNLLDLQWAMWAQEQIDGVRGGGKTRIYPKGACSGLSNMRDLAWYYFGIGQPGRPSSPLLSALLSTWRPPLVVIDLALDEEERGRYEIQHRPMGLAMPGYHSNPDYRLNTEGGGIVCYSWCTPDFILGTPMVEARPLNDWVRINSQNRWGGAIFAGHPHARICPLVKAADDTAAFNSQWSVQRKGTLITQKLKTSQGTENMRVWFSQAGLSTPTLENGWVFVEAPKAFAAVRVLFGGSHWEQVTAPPPAPSGAWLCCEHEWTPVILEVANKLDFSGYEHFRQSVAALPVSFTEGMLAYKGLSGDEFVFNARQTSPPEINDDPVNYTPSKVLYSPFLRSDWNSGVITIEKEDRRMVLDFNRE